MLSQGPRGWFQSTMKREATDPGASARQPEATVVLSLHSRAEGRGSSWGWAGHFRSCSGSCNTKLVLDLTQSSGKLDSASRLGKSGRFCGS